jgi:hypothetical protein
MIASPQDYGCFVRGPVSQQLVAGCQAIETDARSARKMQTCT